MSLVDSPALEPLPERVAIIMGREADGVSKEMLQTADRSVRACVWGTLAQPSLSCGGNREDLEPCFSTRAPQHALLYE